MSDYGVKPTGVVIKRMDIILDELHTDLSGGLGVNTRLNPKSFLNVLLTDIADKYAELWEFGKEIYDSMYPFSAENASLDNVAQYGGISREDARPTYYPVHCECVDGTLIPKGTMIKSDTNPAINFLASNDSSVTRSAFNIVKIRAAIVNASAAYTAAIDGTLYTITSGSAYTDSGGVLHPTAEEILADLCAAITDDGLSATVEENLLRIESLDITKQHALVLSGNLTTESVTGIVTFASEDVGEVVLPNGTITQIVTSITGLLGVNNLSGYIAGRLRESDAGLRQSYVEKIFARSNRMIESVKSAILSNVQGVSSVAGYQNDKDTPDAQGRWPHCVEFVVDGGDDTAIAMQIWDKKTDGISSFGSTEVTIPGDEGEPITIRFNRPEHVYVWFRAEVKMSAIGSLPSNYVEAIKDILIAKMKTIDAGRTIIPQSFISEFYTRIPGIGHLEIPTFSTTDSGATPNVYSDAEIAVTPRQRVITDEARIEVVLVA